MPGNPRVMSGVLWISVTEVVLHRAQIRTLIGRVVAARMAQHVRPDMPELCSLASDPHDIIDGLAGELCLPLRHEQPGQVVFPGGEVALDRAQLIAGDRVLDAQAALEASDPQPRPLDIELVATHLDGLADPQAVPVDHQQKGVVANAVAPLLCRLEQAIDLRTVQKILRALVRVGRPRLTLYLSPVGRPSLRASKVLVLSSVSTAHFVHIARNVKSRADAQAGVAMSVRLLARPPSGLIKLDGLPITLAGVSGPWVLLDIMPSYDVRLVRHAYRQVHRVRKEGRQPR